MAFVIDERNTSVNIGGMIMTQEYVRTRGGGGEEEMFPLPLCPPQIIHKLPRSGIRTSAHIVKMVYCYLYIPSVCTEK